jgi:hypothetical protein
MDARIRRRAIATALAVAAILPLASGVVRAAASAEAPDPGPRTAVRKPAAPPAGHAAKPGTRLRRIDRPPSAPRVAAAVVPPAALGPRRPLELTLTQDQFGSILGKYPVAGADSGAHSAFDDVTVMARAELQPMRDPAREVWGGIGAPVWALLHPTQAWRIFVPIPPK